VHGEHGGVPGLQSTRDLLVEGAVAPDLDLAYGTLTTAERRSAVPPRAGNESEYRRGTMQLKQRTFSVWYALIAIAVFVGGQALFLAPHPDNI
jgi:hypothetical protein